MTDNSSMRILLPVVFLAASCCNHPELPESRSNFLFVWNLMFTDTFQSGSGVPLKWEDGRMYFATAAHMQDEDTGQWPDVATLGFVNLYDVRLEWQHETADLAILSYQSSAPNITIPVRREPLAPGERVLLVGYPHGGPLLVFQGLAQGSRTVTGTIAPGMSGGAVLDESGRLCAIISQYRSQETAQQDLVLWGEVGFVIPTSLLP